jgi:hypothetical protein
MIDFSFLWFYSPVLILMLVFFCNFQFPPQTISNINIMNVQVRLWHVSTNECLHCFPHADFVTSVDFHPKNDLLFLSGCFDKRLRVWSIPESHVAAWATTPEMITSVCFSPTGNQALAGLFNGQVSAWVCVRLLGYYVRACVRFKVIKFKLFCGVGAAVLSLKSLLLIIFRFPFDCWERNNARRSFIRPPQVFFWHTDSQGLEVQHVSTLAGGGGVGSSSSGSFDAGGGFDAGVAPGQQHGNSSGGGGGSGRGMPASAGGGPGGSSSASGGANSSLAGGGGGAGGFGHLPPLAAAAHVQLRYYTQVRRTRLNSAPMHHIV